MNTVAEQPNRVSLRHSLRSKFALSYLAIVAVVVVLLNTYPVLIAQDLIYEAEGTSLQNQASVLASALAGPEPLTPDGVERTLALLGVPGLRRVMVTDPAGVLLYDCENGERLPTEGRCALYWELTTALKGRDVARSKFQSGAFHSRAAVPISYRGMTMGAVCLYEYDAQQGALLLGIQKQLRSMSILISAMAVVMSVVFSRALTRRMGALLGAIRKVREGEYSHRVPVTGKDELSQLGEEFNALTGRLQTTEEVRRRFVSDASHELKTPLASIRLLTDSILQAEHIDTQTVREFVSDIGEEAGRLTRITEKLLILTKMDSALPVKRVPVDPTWVVEKVRHMLLPLVSSQGVELETCLAEDCLILATEDDLYQVAFNLMENAVKYNVPGGRVLVTVEREEGPGGPVVILRVEDTGLGIPEDAMDRIFDRFYRVDKARSRAAGGTGLGLSIVRDTARQHGGEVTVRRREPEGTCFEARFPLWQEKEGET